MTKPLEGSLATVSGTMEGHQAAKLMRLCADTIEKNHSRTNVCIRVSIIKARKKASKGRGKA